MEFICAKCNQTLDKTSDLLIKGCHNCGSKVFKTKSTSTNESTIIRTIPRIEKEQIEDYSTSEFRIVPKLISEEEEEEEERRMKLHEDNIPAIKLREKGVYDVNLESLFRDKKTDPIILSGKQGIYRIEIFPVKK